MSILDLLKAMFASGYGPADTQLYLWLQNFVTNRMNKDRALMLDKFHKQILHEVRYYIGI